MSRYTNGQIEKIREDRKLYWATMPDSEREALRAKMLAGMKAYHARKRAEKEAAEAKAVKAPAMPSPAPVPLVEPPASYLSDAVAVFRAERDSLQRDISALNEQIRALEQQQKPLQERAAAIKTMLDFYDREVRP